MRNTELLKKRKDFLEKIFKLFPEIKDTEYIRPVQDKIRVYRDALDLNDPERQLAYMFIVQAKYFKEIYPNRYIA